MRHSITFCVLATVVSLFSVPNSAFAAVGTCIGTISLIVEQPSTSTAHVISFANTGCTDACTGSRRAYIDFNDKQLYAIALSAVMAGSTVGVMYDTNAASKGSSSSEHNSNITCKVLNIWK